MPHPYLILAAVIAFLGAYMGGNLHGHRAERIVWEKALAEQKAEAGKVLANALQRVRDKENQDAETARRIDETHAHELAVANAGLADFERRLRETRRRASCGNTPATPAVNPGISADIAPGGDDGSRTNDPASSLREAALDLQRYALACHSWAKGVGR